MFDPKALRQFLDVLSDAVLVLDRSARISFANIAALRLLGAETGAALSQLAPLLGDSLVGAVSRVCAKGVARVGGSSSPVLPEALSLPDGRRFSVALSPLENERWALRLATEVAHNMAPSAAAAPDQKETAALFIVNLL